MKSDLGSTAWRWEDLAPGQEPWPSPARFWHALSCLAGAAAGVLLTPGAPLVGLMGCAVASLTLARLRSGRLGTVCSLAAAILAGGGAALGGWLLQWGIQALAIGYRWDLRSPGIEQIWVVSAMGRGVAAILLATFPAILQPHTPRWVPAVWAGALGGISGQWLIWPIHRQAELPQLLQSLLWTAWVLGLITVAERVYGRLNRVRRWMRQGSIVLGVLALIASGAGVQCRLPLLAVADCAGPRIYSFAANWQRPDELHQVCQTLSQNQHAAEWQHLDRVVLLPGAAVDATTLAGQYFVGPRYAYTQSGSAIEVYYVDQAQSAQDLSRTLSHEYGHHFTIYYLKEREGVDWTEFRRTRWAQVRGIADLRGVGDVGAPYPLRAAEIAAEDYALLFGTAQEPADPFVAAWAKARVPPVRSLPQVRTYWEEVWRTTQ